MAELDKITTLLETFLTRPDGNREDSVVVRGSVAHSVVAFGAWTIKGQRIELTRPKVPSNPNSIFHTDLPGPHIDMMWDELRKPEIEIGKKSINFDFGFHARVCASIPTEFMTPETTDKLVGKFRQMLSYYKHSDVSFIATPSQRVFFEMLASSAANLTMMGARENVLRVSATGEWRLSREIFPPRTVYPQLEQEGFADIFRLTHVHGDIVAELENPGFIESAVFEEDGGPGKNEPSLSLFDGVGVERIKLFNTTGYGSDETRRQRMCDAVDQFNSGR